MATADGAMTPSTTPTTSFVNITSLVNIRLDMLSTAYRRWRRLFLVVLGRFCLTHHIDGSPALPLDPIWLQDDLTVLMWLHATLADDLLDMVMDDDITAHGVWKKIGDFFLSNKASRVVHLEQELHNLAQGELSAAAYRHRLKTLSDALADCDQPVQDRALVHQMIRGLNPKYHVLRQMLPAMPTFPTFMEARDQLIVAEQTLNMSTTSMTDSTALLSTNGTDFTNNGSSTSARQDNDRGQQSTGRGNGGRGRGNYRGRNRGRGTGRGNNNGGRGQAPQVPVWFQQMPPWVATWLTSGSQWRAPWTGSSGPGLQGARPPAQAFNAGYLPPSPQFAPPTPPSFQFAPPASPSFDTSGLLQALQAATLPQQNTSGDWYMDTGASSHMTGEAGNLPVYFPHLFIIHLELLLVMDLLFPFMARAPHTLPLPPPRFV